jgi:hypothetical protein
MHVQMGHYELVDNHQLRREGHKGRIGYTYRKPDGQVYWEGRCPICGEQLSHNFTTDRDKFIREGKWDFKKKRMIFCGKNKLCSDWYYEYLKDKAAKTEKLYEQYKAMGLVA